MGLTLSSRVVGCLLQRLRTTGILTGGAIVAAVISLGGLSGCAESALPPPLGAPPYAVTGAWLAPRGGVALDSPRGASVLRKMRGLGVRWVAVGEDVTMPKLRGTALTFGANDAALRGFLRRAKAAGAKRFLLPRIESPDFFVPPYPFRADIDFPTKAAWGAFHANMERMILHYARLAQAEGVELFGLGLELKHSVRKHPAFWRALITKVRQVYTGKLTYSANWYDEWRDIEFWGALDYIGIGAYFELAGPEAPGTADVATLVRRWDETRREIVAASAQHGVPVLFTEVGYTGYVDCAERPWEWAGKEKKGIAIDHGAQARATEALFRIVRASDAIHGLFLWSFYTEPAATTRAEYAVQGRPVEAVVRQFFRAAK